MLSARDKEQVHKWSQRQLGDRCRLASIYEKELTEMDSWVEKGGTGIESYGNEDCSPLMSITSLCSSVMPDDPQIQRDDDLATTGNLFQIAQQTIH